MTTDLPSSGVLDARWGRAGAVRFEERYGGTVAVLEAAGASAAVAVQGAQVLSYVPHNHREALWLSPQAQLGTGRPVRGGIPICWPWFGPHPSDASKPAHGFVRARPWQVIGSASSADRVRLVLSFEPAPADQDLWPNRAGAEIEITLGETLRVSLTTENRGSRPIAITEALHTYLSIGDVDAVSVEGLAGCPFIDQLAPGEMGRDAGPIRIDREIDRIYQESDDTVAVTDHNLKRRISIAKSGSRSTVLWNPWIEKSARLGDLGEAGYRRMLCLEAANAGNDTVTLAPGARHRLVTEISVAALVGQTGSG